MQTERVMFGQLIRPVILVGLFCALIICQGCSQTGNLFGNVKQKLTFNEDEIRLKKAFTAYKAGRLTEAAKMFQELYDNSGSLTVRRQALYGLSICRMVMAETPKAYVEAHSTWRQWRQIREIRSECEDPVYLEPFLKCKFATDNNTKTQTKIQGACAEIVTKYQYEKAQDRIGVLESELKDLNDQYKQIKTENDTLARSRDDKDEIIKTLKEKIKALEDIDQKIQEKKNKTEISSPE